MNGTRPVLVLFAEAVAGDRILNFRPETSEWCDSSIQCNVVFT
jgi:hypothetical protein